MSWEQQLIAMRAQARKLCNEIAPHFEAADTAMALARLASAACDGNIIVKTGNSIVVTISNDAQKRILIKQLIAAAEEAQQEYANQATALSTVIDGRQPRKVKLNADGQGP